MAIKEKTHPAGVATSGRKFTTLNATSVDDAGGATNTTIFSIEIDATANTGEDVYFKLYDNAAPTVGTTAPNMVLKQLAGTKKTWVCKRGQVFTDVSVACVQEPGQGGTTSPSGVVDVDIDWTTT